MKSKLDAASTLKRKLELAMARADLDAQRAKKAAAGDNGVKDQPASSVYVPSSTWQRMHAHQREAVEFLKMRTSNDRQAIGTGAILADDMGTGKTCTGIMTMWILSNELRTKGLIVCPAGLVGNWEQEINKWLPESLARTAVILNTASTGKSTKVRYRVSQ